MKRQGSTVRHLLLHLPEGWSENKKGEFFEQFVADILRPLRYGVVQRLRFTGMEIDLLARALDHSHTVFVECKAQRDPLPADTISKLLGNVTIRGADAGWLFSTSELTKDGRGQWEEIQANPTLAKRFSWYPPGRLIEILIDQGAVMEPSKLVTGPGNAVVGDATLICSPQGRHWLVELLEEGVPTYYSVFGGATGTVVDEAHAKQVASASERFASLKYFVQETEGTSAAVPILSPQAPVARVVPGDEWADLRPARPIDFVGRDDIIQEVLTFVTQVRLGQTTTRTFAIQGPSGWGKSSLVLKLSELANRRRRLDACSLTAVDTRSATNAAFVSSALRLAFADAAQAGLIPEGASYDISSLTHPLDSPRVSDGVSALIASQGVIILVFDQFEELFTKESLFETFNAIRDLSLDLDSKQVPLILGFAWKTDISLPQEHPAYHLWHELAGRRRDFAVRQFGSGDIAKVISRAEREAGFSRLQPALRARLIEQCQGYPWLLKKLLVHVGKRLKTAGSQYALLERELDVEVLFKEDLEGLKAEQLRCLKYVAQRAPAYVSEVEEQFRSEVTNFLLSKGLLVRSGLNYVVYWDIFRDYLTEKRVPQIPWARTFQRDPRSAVGAAQQIQSSGTVSAGQIARVLGGKESSWVNVMSDLVALQIVDRIADDQYKLAPHIRTTSPADLAQHIHTQLVRHVVCRELASHDRGATVAVEDLEAIVRRMKSGTQLSNLAIHQYSMNLKRWLLFAGHLEERGAFLYRPAGRGAQMGQLRSSRSTSTRFMASGTPGALLALIRRLQRSRQGLPVQTLLEEGLRNTLYDSFALQLAARTDDGMIKLLPLPGGSRKSLVGAMKLALLHQSGFQIVAKALGKNAALPNDALGEILRTELKEGWKITSARRYANGFRQYFVWTTEN